MSLESVILAAGKTVADRAGRLWLSSRSMHAERGKDLIELIQARFPDLISRRRTERQIADIADSVTERLLSLCAHEYGGLSENDKAAIIAEVTQTLIQTDLSDEAIFAVDADAAVLARQIRETMPKWHATRQLGEAGARLYEVILDECLDCLIRIVRHLPQFGPRATAETLSRLSGLANQIAVVLTRLPARTLDAPSGSNTDEEFTQRYLAHISEDLDSIEMFGVPFERFRPRTTLSVAYISLSVSSENTVKSSNKWRKSSLNDWRVDDVDTTVRVESALGRNPLILVRGEAGAGKSTLLRWLAITAARGSYTADLSEWNGSVPFLIKLRSYADRKLPTPEEFLSESIWPLSRLVPNAWAHRQLNSGRALLLVDGVDELSSSQRHHVRKWLTSLLATYPHIRVVVTSRPAAVGSDWLINQGFSTVFLERMSSADTRALIQHWHVAVRDCADLPWPVEKIHGYESSLLSRLEAAPHLRNLATNPLLAAMLCALNLDHETQLPPNRMGLYNAALGLLLERRDSQRQIPSYRDVSLEREQKVQLLQYLAYRLSFTNRIELPRDVAEQMIADKISMMPRVRAEAKDVLEYLLQRSGLLREPIKGRIDFVHRTIQEYLTAKEIAHDSDIEPLIMAAHLDQWWEVIVMTVGHANTPLRIRLFQELLARIRAEPRHARRLKLLIAACQETLSDTPRILQREINACIADLVPPRDRISARSLAMGGDAVLERLPRSLEGLSAAVAQATIRTAYSINGPEALDLLEAYVTDPRDQVHEELINGWPHFDLNEYISRILTRLPLISNIPISTSKQLEVLGRLPPIKSIHLYPQDVDVAKLLAHKDSLSRLTIVNMGKIDNLSKISSLQNLKSLNIHGLSNNFKLNLSSPLPELESLFVQVKKILNLKFLLKMHNLKYLYLDSLANVSDFTPLMQVDNLQCLSLTDCKELKDVNALPPLADIVELTIVKSFLTCSLDELIVRAPKLRNLNLRDSLWVNDLSALSTMPLRHLTLWGCPNVVELSPLSKSDTLTFLDLEETGVNDVSALSSLASLKTIYLRGCSSLSDVSPLADLPNLENLYIEGIAPGVDVSAFVNNKTLKIHAERNQNLQNANLLGEILKRG